MHKDANMTEEERAKAALAAIEAEFVALDKIVQQVRADGDYQSGCERLKRWKSQRLNCSTRGCTQTKGNG